MNVLISMIRDHGIQQVVAGKMDIHTDRLLFSDTVISLLYMDTHNNFIDITDTCNMNKYLYSLNILTSYTIKNHKMFNCSVTLIVRALVKSTTNFGSTWHQILKIKNIIYIKISPMELHINKYIHFPQGQSLMKFTPPPTKQVFGYVNKSCYTQWRHSGMMKKSYFIMDPARWKNMKPKFKVLALAMGKVNTSSDSSYFWWYFVHSWPLCSVKHDRITRPESTPPLTWHPAPRSVPEACCQCHLRHLHH